MRKIEISRQKKILIYQLPAILWLIAIFIQSSIPHLSVPDLGVKLQDKFAHVLEFAILAILFRRFFVFNTRNNWQQKKYLYIFFVGTFYAVFDELHQGFVPGRTADVYDVLADVTGVLITISIYRLLKSE